MKNPLQPVVIVDGIARFKENKIVSYLLDKGGLDMNLLAMEDFTDEDREQFAQLIGYSVSGFGSLSYASDEAYYLAEWRRKRIPEVQKNAAQIILDHQQRAES